MITKTLFALCCIVIFWGGSLTVRRAAPFAASASASQGAQATRDRNNTQRRGQLVDSQREKLSSPLQVREVNADGLAKLLQPDATTPKQILLVNFWATWCVPCREEFPDLVRLNEKFKTSPRFRFITVSLDDASEINKSVPQFLREMGATKMPAYLLNTPEPETAINAVDPTWNGGLPATFLFDAERRIVFKHVGRINPTELGAAIQQTMNAEK